MIRTSNSGTRLDQSWPFALADGEVSFVGEPVAIVVADDRYVAEDAAALVAVDYDVLPAATRLPNRRSVRPPCAARSAPTRSLPTRSPLATSSRRSPRPRTSCMRSFGFIAAPAIPWKAAESWWKSPTARPNVWASTQKAHDLRYAFADYIDLDENRLRVATPDVGGGFGPKLCVYPEDVAVVAAATLLRRSIKWIEDRREHFTNAAQERDQYWSIEIAADADGRVRGVRGRLTHDHRRLCACRT